MSRAIYRAGSDNWYTAFRTGEKRMKVTEKLIERNHSTGNTRPVLIAFIGDSVTHGCFEVEIEHDECFDIAFDSMSAYPYLLKRKLDSLYPAAALLKETS